MKRRPIRQFEITWDAPEAFALVIETTQAPTPEPPPATEDVRQEVLFTKLSSDL